ncbi:MAG: hypothetical protein RLZZ362_931, partial [Actinomycetota bacterium]
DHEHVLVADLVPRTRMLEALLSSVLSAAVPRDDLSSR